MLGYVETLRFFSVGVMFIFKFCQEKNGENMNENNKDVDEENSGNPNNEAGMQAQVSCMSYKIAILAMKNRSMCVYWL